MKSISVKAFAKINVGLRITGRRPDGYHTLETVFAPVDWYDVLTFSPADSITMSCSNRELACDESNLCVRAARALADFAGLSHGVRIELEKNIPFGAGLGGGSSDAAATLAALNRFWAVHAPLGELHRLATSLGADVPYFLESKGLAYATGIGEELEDLNLSLPFWVVTLFPGEQISTVWAYKNFHPRFERDVPDLRHALRALCEQKDTSVCSLLENDFETAVFEHFPAVGGIKDELLDAGSLYASLSGSGSAVFGLFHSEDDARCAVGRFESRCRCALTPPSFTMS